MVQFCIQDCIFCGILSCCNALPNKPELMNKFSWPFIKQVILSHGFDTTCICEYFGNLLTHHAEELVCHRQVL